MSDQPQWFVMQGEEQLGPYSGEQLVEYGTAGNITPESMVWAEGMEEWLPAGQIEGIFPAQAIQAVPVAVAAAQGVPPYGTNPYQAPGTFAALSPTDPYPSPGVKNTSFALWIGLFLGGITLIIIGLVIGSAAASTIDAAEGAEVSNAQAGGMGIGLILGLVGYFVMIFSCIPVYITLYRAWKCLQAGGMARTTPGQAIGFMFIPFFNIYWLFQTFYGLAKDWNQTMDTYDDLKAAPRLSEGVFLTLCIGSFLGFGVFLLFPAMSQMCRGINYFTFRPQPGEGPDLGGGGGGLHIGGGFTVR